MIFKDEKKFDKADEFISFFQNDPSFRTRRIWEANTVGRGSYIYRGQSNSDWCLMPSVFRSNDALGDYTPQIPGEYSGKRKIPWLGWHLHAELRAVFIFLETADKLGIETPIDYTRAKDHYDLIYSALNDNDYDYSQPFPNEKTLEELALAQHHGIPTRILDWTESPLIACFFAALGASRIPPTEDGVESNHIAVTCFNTGLFSKSDEIIKVNSPRHRNNFLRNQQGIFTHIPRANSYFLNHEKWPSVEDIVKNTKELNGALKKYYLPATEADELLRILYDYGITTHQMMPSLDNVAKAHSYAARLFKLA